MQHVELIKSRLQLMPLIATMKYTLQLPICDLAVEERNFKIIKKLCRKLKLDDGNILKFFTILFALSKQIQREHASRLSQQIADFSSANVIYAIQIYFHEPTRANLLKHFLLLALRVLINIRRRLRDIDFQLVQCFKNNPDHIDSSMQKMLTYLQQQ